VSSALRIPITKNAPFRDKSGRRATIEFVDPLSDDHLTRTIECLELWGTASFGAYGRSEEEVWHLDSAIFDVTADVMDDWTVEVSIERFGAPEVAWLSLMNLSGRFTDIARVAKIVIE
jgi:hypothetical protein